MASFKFILTIFMLFSLYIQTGLAEVASTPTSEVSPADESIQTPLPYANIDNSTAEESSVDNDDKASADAKDDDDLDVSSDPYDPYTIFEGCAVASAGGLAARSSATAPGVATANANATSLTLLAVASCGEQDSNHAPRLSLRTMLSFFDMVQLKMEEIDDTSVWSSDLDFVFKHHSDRCLFVFC
ncbi:hypothetical protein BDV59DRAFT_203424 [Aspergillus ambiguus]|uniref:uncharacterized protein n=1 Tax=Aspergillus ambiguus TaxID=176160 RepID=UPI003CCD7F3F